VTRVRDLKDQLLAAAFAITGGDLDAVFSSEELLIQAWSTDPTAWGLRGFEKEHPDADRIHRELDSRGKGQKGLVDQGLVERIRPRTYRLTPEGLLRATHLAGSKRVSLERLDRVAESEIRRILEHPVFRCWLENPAEPRSFSEAGYFWGIAAGTPPGVIRQRIGRVDQWLVVADQLLSEKGVDEVAEGSGRPLFERNDIARCREFQTTLKERFGEPLRRLGVADLT